MKEQHLLSVISVLFILLFCGCASNARTTGVENNLFSQPQNDGDSTCGIRQTLISQKVLAGSDTFYTDILAMWRNIYAQTLANYPNGVPKKQPTTELTQMFEKPLPTVYTEASVKVAHGGPFTPPSSILNVLKDNGYQMVQYYIDEPALTHLFGDDFLGDELATFSHIFPQAQRIDIDASISPKTLRSRFSNTERYYIVVVNDGRHWIGVTPTTVYDSLAIAPVSDTINFGKLNGDLDKTRYNSFTGLVIEIQKKK